MSNLVVTLRAGMSIYPDSWDGMFSNLIDADDFDKSYFGDRINYRLPSPNFMDIESAVKIEVTGRTIQRHFYQDCIRGKVTWLTDDGEQEQESPCWIALGWNDWYFDSPELQNLLSEINED